MNNEKEIAKFWLNVSAYYRQTLPDEVLKMYVYDCKTTSMEELRFAFEKYRQTSQAAFFPLPAVLKNIINPPIDPDAEANCVPAIIFESMKRFGQYRGSEAKDHMGELAWQCVNGFGGWGHLCSNNMGSESSVRAQLRDLAKSYLTRRIQGREHLALGQGLRALLPEASQANENAVPSHSEGNPVARLLTNIKTLD